MKIAIVGDVMLDVNYNCFWPTRISQEAPVPILNIDNTDFSLGGAAKTALYLKSFKPDLDVNLFGCIGKDREGEIIEKDLQLVGINNWLKKVTRPTTTKNRMLVGKTQLLRFDNERTGCLGYDVYEKMLDELVKLKPDAIVISDYDKGVLFPSFIEEIKEMKIVMFVDPKKRNLNHYNNISYLKVNSLEYQWLAKVFSAQGVDLCNEQNIDNLIVTSDHTLSLFTKFEMKSILIIKERVVTVGAGDIFFAYLVGRWCNGHEINLERIHELTIQELQIVSNE